MYKNDAYVRSYRESFKLKFLAELPKEIIPKDKLHQPTVYNPVLYWHESKSIIVKILWTPV